MRRARISVPVGVNIMCTCNCSGNTLIISLVGIVEAVVALQGDMANFAADLTNQPIITDVVVGVLPSCAVTLIPTATIATSLSAASPSVAS